MIWTIILGSFMAFANPSEGEQKSEESEKKAEYAAESESKGKPYVFGWMEYSQPSVKLRGGTTQGTPVTLATEPSDRWTSLQEKDLDSRERDRRAILAMSGDYRISFDFLEVELYGVGAELSKPYRSWATERVMVIEESDDLISLQHIIVMFMQMPDGTTQGPMLIKHWRQDWEFEPESALEFIGDRQWKNRSLSDEERAGQWQQTVFQVDDSPRYTMRGRWEHTAAYSAWHGDSSWRPLPRREYSVRSDYQALVGTNRLTILPTGWVHSQDNIKTVLSSPGVIDTDNPALAREFGLNRYERIVDFDFSESETYWSKTAEYWEKVRKAWAKHLSSAPTVKVATKCKDKRIYESLFELAGQVAKDEGPSEKKLAKSIETTLSCSVSTVQ